MKQNQITKADLALQIREDNYTCGAYLHYKGYSGLELYQITEVLENNCFHIAEVQLPEFTIGETQRISLESLKQYYSLVTVPMDKLDSLSRRLVDGEQMVDLEQELDANDTGTELLQLLKGLWLLVNRRLLNLKKVVKPYRTRKVKILRAQNAAISLDGRQLYNDCPLDVRILPEALTLIIPE